jgi:hypothetical protein
MMSHHPLQVIPGLDRGIFTRTVRRLIPGSSPGMTWWGSAMTVRDQYVSQLVYFRMLPKENP